MARNLCYKKVQIPKKTIFAPGSGYGKVDGKELSIFPPSCCYPNAFSLSGTDYSKWCDQPPREYTDEELKCFKELKTKYGFSNLFVWLNNIEAALQAGWKCSELILFIPSCSDPNFSCKSMIEYISCAMHKLTDPQTGQPRDGCELAKFKYVYLDEPNILSYFPGRKPSAFDHDGDYRSSKCHPCHPAFLLVLKRLINNYNTEFVIGHWSEQGIDTSAPLADGVTMSTYHLWLRSNQSGMSNDPFQSILDTVWDPIQGAFAYSKYDWNDLNRKYGTRRFWVSASRELASYSPSTYDPDQYDDLLNDANRLNANELMIYAWEIGAGIPCDERMSLFKKRIQELTYHATQHGWLKPP